MATLTQRRTNPDALYEAVEGFSSPHGTFARGAVVRGAHPAVIHHRALFMPADLDDIQKADVRRDYWRKAYGQMAADAPAQKAPPRAYRPSGPMRAVAHFTIEEKEFGGPKVLNAGDVVDASDPEYRAFPHLFEPVR